MRALFTFCSPILNFEFGDLTQGNAPLIWLQTPTHTRGKRVMQPAITPGPLQTELHAVSPKNIRQFYLLLQENATLTKKKISSIKQNYKEFSFAA